MSYEAASQLFASLDRELWIVTASDGSHRGGLIATFVSEASIVPELPRVLIGLNRQHHTWGLVEASGRFALHLLTEDQLDWVWRFGLRSGRDVEKFEGLEVESSPGGNPILAAAPGWLDCRVENRMESGDRTVYLAEILEGRFDEGTVPLTKRRLLELAPAEKLAELKRQMQRDAAGDATAIRTWRQQMLNRDAGLDGTSM